MYRSIYVPTDNSPAALRAIDLGLAIAQAQNAQLTASHVYAAKLHDRRFRQMESGLPEPYREQDKLIAQREVHDELIARGLGLISDAYLDACARKCEAAGRPCARVSLEGRNWRRLVEDIAASAHDLVIMGAVGLGAVEVSMLGSVCARVARRIDRDLLVVKAMAPAKEGAILVAIDGSAQSFSGLKTALELAGVFGKPVEAVAAFDPDFHRAAFHGLAGVLTPEAAAVFRFREQERLHEEIIDHGLAKIYQAHLDIAAKLAAEAGIELRTELLAGKAVQQILKCADERQPSLLVAGRFGSHADDCTELGSTAENLLRLAPCDVLLAASAFTPPAEQTGEASLAWTDEARARIERVPRFARGMATGAVIRHAIERGHTMITSDLIDDCLKSLLPASEPPPERAGHGARCPFAHLASDVAGRARQAASSPDSPDPGGAGSERKAGAPTTAEEEGESE